MYHDRARCFSGRLIVSYRPCSTDRAQSLQLQVKRHAQEAHECEAAELSHELYFKLIKAGLFAAASYATGFEWAWPTGLIADRSLFN